MNIEKWTKKYKRNIISRLIFISIIMALDIIFILRYFSTFILGISYYNTYALSLLDFLASQSPLFCVSLFTTLSSFLIGTICMCISIMQCASIIEKEQELSIDIGETFITQNLISVIISDLTIVISITTWIFILFINISI